MPFTHPLTISKMGQHPLAPDNIILPSLRGECLIK